MKIYNTLTRQKEEFKSIEDNHVKMYVCGPTVYDYIHIGNARPLVVFDTLRRYLEYKGYSVDFVMNFTDVDDKIIDKALDLGVEFQKVSEKYIQAFKDNAESLNVKDDNIIHPKATDHIGNMIEFIQSLEDKGAAYETENTVYFNIDKAKNYGSLSRKNIEDLQSGSRVDIDKNKKNPLDFALWKKQKDPKEPAWDSPWGKGRPGWHIECSVMVKNTLGETIDIHGGGEDLQFPHHENEIAQSETLHDKNMANYWMHNGMITVNKEKMAKSKGNFFTLKDIEKEYDLLIIRMWLISAHYRSQIDFSKEAIEHIKASYDRLSNTYDKISSLEEASQIEEMSLSEEKNLEKAKAIVVDFEAAMDDDLNTAKALSFIFELSRLINIWINLDSSKIFLSQIKEIFVKLSDILGIEYKSQSTILDKNIESLIEERNEARANKDWVRADEIRDYLKEKNIELKDTPSGVIWKKI